MALHPHLINPNHHLPRATQKSQRRFWPRAPCHARLCDRLNLRASPLTSHCAGGRRGASSAFAEPLTVQSLASAATLSTAPPPACAADRQPGRCHARCPVTSTRGAIRGPTGGMHLPDRDRDVVGWEPVGCSGGAPGTRPTRSMERRAVYGRELTGHLEAAPGTVVSTHHRAPQTESAKCTEKVAP